jgi:hypothetical protein
VPDLRGQEPEHRRQTTLRPSLNLNVDLPPEATPPRSRVARSLRRGHARSDTALSRPVETLAGNDDVTVASEAADPIATTVDLGADE